MRQQPINLIGGFYADETRHWSTQDTVNWLPVSAEHGGTLTPTKLVTPPGLTPYQKIGTGPIRGMYNCEGVRLVVSGRMLYRITNAGVGVPLGTIPGVGRVDFSHNQFKGGNQVLVTNGAPGGGYVYDTSNQTLSRISDPGFPGSLMTDYIDSYLLGVEPAGRFWFHSNLADATDYNTLDRYEAEAAPDRIVGLAVNQFEVIIFGQRTVEFFGNAGGATGTFQSKRVVIERGCASRHSIVKMDNSVIWLGDDGIIYRLNGYQAQRISTVPLERAIAGNRWGDAFAFAWEDRGHKIYYLTMPDGHTWGFDVVSGLWHRRQSYGLNRWRPNAVAKWGAAWFAGDFQDGRIWRMEWGYPAEGDQPMVSERTSPVYSDSQSPFIIPSAELIFSTGQKSVDLLGDEAFPEQPPIPVLSGNAPNSYIGAEYSYTYTVTSGTAPFKFSIISGELPDGITLDPETGEISGTMTEAGTSDFRVRVTDKNGMFDDLDDSILVGAAIWLVKMDFIDSSVWVSGDAVTWDGPFERAPFVVASGKGSGQIPGGPVVILGGSTAGERTYDFVVADGIDTESITVPSGVGRIRRFGDVVLAFYGANVANANTYWSVSMDAGTWTAHTLPSNLRIRDAVRLESGRWYSHQEYESTYGMYYSDQDVPTSWISSGYSEVPHGDRVMVTDGRNIMMRASNDRVMRFRHGQGWDTLTPSISYLPDARAALHVNGRWMFGGQRNGPGNVNFAYSDNLGVSWTTLTIPGVDSVENLYSVNGLIVASGRAIVGAEGRSNVCVSRDNGSTWEPTETPFAVASGSYAVAFPVE